MGVILKVPPKRQNVYNFCYHYFDHGVLDDASRCFMFKAWIKTLSWIYFYFLRVDEQQELDILCAYCFRYEKEQVAATSFCKTCENPDPMCEACSKYHIRQELSKSHKICGDIDKFPKRSKQTRYFYFLYIFIYGLQN